VEILVEFESWVAIYQEWEAMENLEVMVFLLIHYFDRMLEVFFFIELIHCN